MAIIAAHLILHKIPAPENRQSSPISRYSASYFGDYLNWDLILYTIQIIFKI